MTRIRVLFLCRRGFHAGLKRALPLCMLALCAAGAETDALDELYTEVNACFAAGRYQEAIEPAQRAVEAATALYGGDGTNTAVCLNILGSLYVLTHRYAEAEPLLLRVLRVREQATGAEDPGVAQALNNLASLRVNQGRYAEAEPLLERATAIYRAEGLADDLRVATCLNNLGEVCRHLGAYPRARRHHRAALDIRRAALPPESALVAQSINNLAEIERILGNHAIAEGLFLEGISAAAAGSNVLDEAVLRNNLAFLLADTGHYAPARTEYGRALSLRREHLGGRDLDTAATINDMAVLCHDGGRYDEALRLYLEALDVYTNTLGPRHPRVATVSRNLAGVYAALGRYADAEDQYAVAVQACEQAHGSNHPAVASTLNDFAAFCRRQGKYAEAETLYLRALAIRTHVFGPAHRAVGESRGSLARLYEDQGRYADAAREHEAALAILEASLGTNHPAVARVLCRMAAVQCALSNGAAGSALALRARALQERVLGPRHPDVAATIQCLGDAFLLQGSKHLAEQAYKEALHIRGAALGPLHPDTADALARVAACAARKGNTGHAVALYVRALRVLDGAFAAAGPAALRERMNADMETLCADTLAAVAARRPRRAAPSADAALAFAAMETARAREMLDELVDLDAAQRAGLSRADAGRLASLDGETHLLEARKDATALRGDAPGAALDATQAELALAPLRAQLRALRAEFAVRYPRYASLCQPARLDLAAFQSTVLAPGELALCYWVGQNGLYACAITKDEARFHALAPGRAALRRRVAAFRDVLTPGATTAPMNAYVQCAAGLYADVVAPLLAGRDLSKCTAVYVIPHDCLATIPFDALLRSRTGATFAALDYLGDSVPVAYVPSARVLRQIRENDEARITAAHSGTGAVLFGDPVVTPRQYAGTGAGGEGALAPLAMRSGLRMRGADPAAMFIPDKELTLIVPLPSSRREVEGIAGLLRTRRTPVSVFVGADARESALKSLSATGALLSNRYVHFATHALLPGDVRGIPEPCLVLSLYGDDSDDGFLAAREIMGLRMNADMVTLSACFTGYVDQREYAHGISALARAFFHAGTTRVTAALWNLEDASTTTLVREYYAGLGATNTLAALNQAKRALRSDRRFTHPAFWAGFVLLGEWR
ncbi:CHAT domain-containing protein [bacterium]|nr:CHAT domain-containing protein [bacterium]